MKYSTISVADARRENRRTRTIRRLRVLTAFGGRHRGRLIFGAHSIPCSLGEGGIIARKMEGDNSTPSGRFQIKGLLSRRDRQFLPSGAIRPTCLNPLDGWCDDPESSCYNRPVRLPFQCGHERMWREDYRYDVVLILDHNQRPRQKYRGSAIFVHLTDDLGKSTAGCVAIRPADMRRLLPRLSRSAAFSIQLPGCGNAMPKNR